MPVTLKHDETAQYAFQHPDTGFPMVLKLDDAGNPCVELEDYARDESPAADVSFAEHNARSLTLVVCRMTDLYEAACKLYGAPYYCKDILS